MRRAAVEYAGSGRRRAGTPVGLLLLLLPGLAGAGPAAAEESLDLASVVELALERNPALKVAEERHSEVLGGVREARADAFPQVAFTTGWNRSRSPALLNSPDFEEFLDAFPGGVFEPREQELSALAVELSQPIFTWGKLGAAVDLAELVVDVTDRQIETARLDTALRAAEAYYALLAAREALATFELQERSRRESLDIVMARYDLGEATELERLQAEAALAEVRPSLSEARGRVEVARLELTSVLALEEGSELAVRDAGGPLPAEPSLEGLLRLAFEQRPELADLALQDEALGRQQTVKRSEGKPQVEFNGSYGRTVRLVDNLDDPLFADWQFGVGLRWELFDGGRREGQIAQIESRRRQLRWQLDDLRRLIELEVGQALSDYGTGRARLEAAELAARAAREASRVAAESYREGVALQADWLDAQEREIEAEVLRVQAYYDARVRAARLLRAVGQQPTGSWPSATDPEGDGGSS